MRAINSKGATVALVIGHVAGMMDLAVLPVWIGTLVSGFGYSNAQAGGLVTSFLAGIVLASIVLARQFHRLPGRWIAPAGYAVSALCFLILTQVSGLGAFFALHLLAGLGTGVALSITHGTMGKTTSPHRVFAFGHTAFGVFAVIFLGVAPKAIEQAGPETLFIAMAGIMGVAMLATTLLFPRVERIEAEVEFAAIKRFPPTVWYVILAVLLMNLVQAMNFGFVERIGMDSGYGAERVQQVLLALGIMNLFPALIAVVLERRLPPLKVGIVGAIIQAALAVAITSSGSFASYAAPTVFFAFVMIFTHTFLFGHLARNDPTGRAVAATPAMTMSGSAIGPVLGGVLSEAIGYPALGIASALIAVATVTLLVTARAGSPRLQPA